MRSIVTLSGNHIAIEHTSPERWVLSIDGKPVLLTAGDLRALVADLVAESGEYAERGGSE